MFVDCDALKRVDQVLGYSKALIVVRGSSRRCRLLIDCPAPVAIAPNRGFVLSHTRPITVYFMAFTRFPLRHLNLLL